MLLDTNNPYFKDQIRGVVLEILKEALAETTPKDDLAILLHLLIRDFHAFECRINNELAEIKNRLKNLESDVATLKSDVAVLKSDVAEIKETMATKKELKELEERLNDKMKENSIDIVSKIKNYLDANLKKN